MPVIEIFDLGLRGRLLRIRVAPSRALARLPVSAFFPTISTEALALVIFIAAFALLALAMAEGGSLLLILIAMAMLALSGATFRRAKPWEEEN